MTPYPAKPYKYTYPRYKLRTFFPKNCEMYIIMNYVLGRINTILFLSSPCLVLDRYVVNAWLIVFASIILCVDMLQYTRGLFLKFYARRTYEHLHVSSSDDVKIPLWSQAQHKKTSTQKSQLQTICFYSIYFLLPHPRPWWDPPDPWSVEKFPIFSVSNVETRV